MVRARPAAGASTSVVLTLASAAMMSALVTSTIVAPGAIAAPAWPPAGAAPTALVAPAATGDLSELGAEAFADLSACIAENGSLLAAIVVDESGSLQQTDPDDQRVGAVQAAVDALAGLESSAGGDVAVEANLAVFGADYDELVGWGSPSGEHGQELLDATSGELARHDRAALTDYREALRGAQASIDARRAETGQATCAAVLWFTDGRLDVGDEGAGEQTAAAREELCVAQGVVDNVRAAGTSIIALALFTEGTSGSVTEEDREELRALAEGSTAGGLSCGTAPVPSASASGAYLRADQPDALRRLFSGTGALIQGGTPTGTIVCPGDGCQNGVLAIPVDRAVGSYRVIFETDDGAAPVGLVAPDGTTTTLTEGVVETSSARVATTNRVGLHVTDVTPLADAAVGAWSLVTDPARVTVIDLYYFWGAEIAVDAPAGLVLGQQNEVGVSLLGPDGVPVDPSELASATLDVLVDGVPTDARQRADGTFTVTVDLSGATAASEIEVAVSARASSAPSGIALGPISARSRLATQLPPSYPTIAPTRLELGRLVGDEPAFGTLTLTGSERGATQACFGPAELVGPPDAGELSLGMPDCVDVPADGTVEVAVDLTSDSPADGVVTGTLPVRLTGVDAAETITLDVPVTSTMTRPVNEAARWGLVAGLLALALLIAGGVAWLGRHVSDRYPLGKDVRSASVPVVVTRTGIRRRDGGDLLQLDDFTVVRQPGTTTRFTERGLTFDRRWSWWPWTPLRGRVRATTGAIVVTNGKDAPALDPRGDAAPVEFPGTQQFYLVVDPVPETGGEPSSGTDGEGAVRAQLVILADAPRVQPVIASWSASLRDYQHWAHLVETMVAARATRASAPASGEPSGSPRRTPGREDGPAAPVGAVATSQDGPPSLFGNPVAPAPSPVDGRDLSYPTDAPPPPGSGTTARGSSASTSGDGSPPSIF